MLQITRNWVTLSMTQYAGTRDLALPRYTLIGCCKAYYRLGICVTTCEFSFTRVLRIKKSIYSHMTLSGQNFHHLLSTVFGL
nr:hypothetical transcript [Hymenolepis microstoma]